MSPPFCICTLISPLASRLHMSRAWFCGNTTQALWPHRFEEGDSLGFFFSPSIRKGATLNHAAHQLLARPWWSPMDSSVVLLLSWEPGLRYSKVSVSL